MHILKKIRFALFFLFLSILFFHKILLHPTEMLYPAGDLAIYSFKEHFLVDSIKQFGSIPFWNPYMFGGHPTFSSSEIPLFYPPHLFFFFLPIDLTFGYLFILDIFLFGIFTYLFAKTIGLKNISAAVSATIAMFSGTTILYIYPGQISILDGFIWFPLLLLFCELTIQKKSNRYSVFLGAIIGLMLLSGTLQISLINLLFTFSFFAFRLFFLKTGKLRLMLTPVLSVLIGISLAAIQIIPGLEFARLSTRADGLDYLFASDFSLHPYHLITFFLPHFFGSPVTNNTYWGINGNFWSSCGYLGILPLILSAIALLRKRNKYVVFFACIGIFAILFSFGRFGFVFPFFYDLIPGFNFFRVPGRFLFIYSFSIAILSGFGMSILFGNIKSKFFVKVLKLLCILFLVSLGLSLLVYSNKANLIHLLSSRGYAIGNDLNAIYALILKDASFLAFFLFSSCLLLFARIKRLVAKPVFVFLTFLIILLDLWLFGFKFYTAKNPKEIFKNSPEIEKIIKDKDTFRVFDFKGHSHPLTGRNHIESLTGFDALYLRHYRDFLWLSGDHVNTPHESFFTFYNIKNLTILKLLNTKYILANETAFAIDKTSLEKITPNLYELKETLPRAYIVPNAIVINEQNKILAALGNSDFNPKQTIILEKHPQAPLKNPSSFTPVEIIRDNPNSHNLKASLANPGFLVLSEIWYPGWKAYVDNKEVEIYKTNYVLRSIYLTKGKHAVAFVYHPFSFKIGALISALTLCAILFYLGLGQWKNKMPARI